MIISLISANIDTGKIFSDLRRNAFFSGDRFDIFSQHHQIFSYFPGIDPDLFFIDSTVLRKENLLFFYETLLLRYPQTNIYFFSVEGTVIMETVFSGQPQKWETLSDFFRSKIQENAKTKIAGTNGYCSLENNLNFFRLLHDPSTAYQLNDLTVNIPPDLLFIVCVLHPSDKNRVDPAFSEKCFALYRKLLQDYQKCVADIDRGILVFFDSSENMEVMQQKKKKLVALSRFKNQTAEYDIFHEIRMYPGNIQIGKKGISKSYFEAQETWFVDQLHKPSYSFDDISSFTGHIIKPAKIIEIERLLISNLEYQRGDMVVYYARLWFQEYKDLHYSTDRIRLDLFNLYAVIKYFVFDMYSLDNQYIKSGVEVYEILNIQDTKKLEIWFYTWLNYTLGNIVFPHKQKNFQISRVVEFIDNHLLENISLKSVAGYFFLNPSYLSYLFKKNLNKTFSAFVIEKKMERAVEMLQSNRKVYETANLLGYESIKHFRKTFKKYYHRNPSEYRQAKIEH